MNDIQWLTNAKVTMDRLLNKAITYAERCIRLEKVIEEKDATLKQYAKTIISLKNKLEKD